MIPKPNTSIEQNQLTGLLKIYTQATKNVPFLKYSWIIIATVCILALASYFKLKNSDVFLYAFAVILISFFGFLFSSLLKTKDKFIKYLLYLLISCIVVTIGTAILSFGAFIIWEKPKFYNKLFPVKTNSSNLDTVRQNDDKKTTIQNVENPDPKSNDSLSNNASPKPINQTSSKHKIDFHLNLSRTFEIISTAPTVKIRFAYNNFDTLYAIPKDFTFNTLKIILIKHFRLKQRTDRDDGGWGISVNNRTIKDESVELGRYPVKNGDRIGITVTYSPFTGLQAPTIDSI